MKFSNQFLIVSYNNGHIAIEKCWLTADVYLLQKLESLPNHSAIET